MPLLDAPIKLVTVVLLEVPSSELAQKLLGYGPHLAEILAIPKVMAAFRTQVEAKGLVCREIPEQPSFKTAIDFAIACCESDFMVFLDKDSGFPEDSFRSFAAWKSADSTFPPSGQIQSSKPDNWETGLPDLCLRDSICGIFYNIDILRDNAIRMRNIASHAAAVFNLEYMLASQEAYLPLMRLYDVCGQASPITDGLLRQEVAAYLSFMAHVNRLFSFYPVQKSGILELTRNTALSWMANISVPYRRKSWDSTVFLLDELNARPFWCNPALLLAGAHLSGQTFTPAYRRCLKPNSLPSIGSSSHIRHFDDMASQSPFFSVIIPVYNGELAIMDCIHSILNQDFRNFEIIVVDDASTDDTLRVLSQLAAHDSRIRVFSFTKNSRQGTARNLGILKATGEFLFFMDADDTITSGTFSTAHKRLSEQEVDLLVMGLESKSADNTRNYLFSYADDILEGGAIFEQLLRNKFALGAPGKFYKRNFIINSAAFFREDKVYEDVVFSLMVFHKARKLSTSSHLAYIYQRSANSTTLPVNKDATFLKASLEVFNEFALFPLNRVEQTLALRNQLYSHLYTAVIPALSAHYNHGCQDKKRPCELPDNPLFWGALFHYLIINSKCV